MLLDFGTRSEVTWDVDRHRKKRKFLMFKHIGWSENLIAVLMIVAVIAAGCTKDRIQNPTLVTISVEPRVVEVSGGFQQGTTVQRMLVIQGTGDDMYYQVSSDAAWLPGFLPSSGLLPDTGL